MAKYTSDKGEMKGLVSDALALSLDALLPPVGNAAQWPTRIVRILKNGEEETVSYHHSGQVNAVLLKDERELVLQFTDGRTVVAALTKALVRDLHHQSTSIMEQAMAKKSSGSGKSHRSAVTGQYVKSSYAKSHPKTTVSEKRTSPKKKK